MPSSTGNKKANIVAERLPLTLQAYRLLTAAATPLAPLLVSHRLKRGKELPARLNERYGESNVSRPPGPLVWVHGASVGELLAVIPLIERIREKDFAVLCTSGTVTSANLAEQRLPPGAIHQFVILDTPRFVDRFFDHWQPDLAIFVESDLWPNLIVTSAERGIPLILVNGRLSERSFNRWRRVPATIAALLGCFDLCLAQSDAHAGRYRDLGAPHIVTTGNLKLDVPEPPAAGRWLGGPEGSRRAAHHHRRSLDPCRRGDDAGRSASAPARRFPAAVDDHRAAPSRSRPRDFWRSRTPPASRRRCAHAANCLAPAPRYTSPIPWASLA